MTKVLIIGGVAAGAKAAAKLKRLCPDYNITIYTKEPYVSYSECGMPFYIAGTVQDLEKLIIRTPEEFEEIGIHVKINHLVKHIMPDRKQILIQDLKVGYEFTDNYDKLIIATGATPYKPPIKNNDLKNIFSLRTLDDAKNIRERLLNSKHACILGGNHIGIECLESFIKQNVKTTLIETNNTIMSFFDEDFSKIVETDIKSLYPEMSHLILEDKVIEFNKVKDKIEVKTKNGIIFETDIVLLATGVRPNSEIAQEAGIKLGDSGAIKVDKQMKTNIEDIWAIGDCVEKFNIISKKYEYLPLGSTANKEGRICAINIAQNNDEVFEGVLGSSVVQYFDYTIAKTGLTENSAKHSGFEPIAVTITKLDKPKYMPNARNITLKLVADKNTHKILGAQGIGFGDADKRINIVTPALLRHYTLEEFLQDDITYSPPLSTSIDPILTAGQILLDKLKSKH